MSDALPLTYLARHGETAWTISRQHTGRTDLPLTVQGEAEARRLGARLDGLQFAAVLTSPLQRARRTCELAGFSTAAGGGAMESAHEAAGAHRAANSYTASGNVSQDVDQAAAPSPGPGAPPAAEQSSTTANEPPADDNPSTDHREAGE